MTIIPSEGFQNSWKHDKKKKKKTTGKGGSMIQWVKERGNRRVVQPNT